ncbi:MAG TPA: HAD-IA family hydrolase [Anaerolineaceae bacterium]
MIIKAFIFDFDGVIVDTETCEYTAWKMIYEDKGAQLPIETWAPCLGTSNDAFDPAIHLEKILGKPQNHHELWSLHRKIADRLVQNQPLQPGVSDYIGYAQNMGIRLAIASTSDRPWIQRHFDRLQIEHLFPVVITSEFVTRVKPFPDLYLTALSHLNIRSDEAIAFEDSPHGISAARSAGIYTVALRTPISQVLDQSHANLVLNSLADLSPQGLIQSLPN